MCGIAGRFDYHCLPPDPLWHQRADSLLAHRGPDGNGHYADDYCELVHRRLALLDLSPTGHQPMTNEHEDVFVVFNGEIYNYQELRSRLKKAGHTFRGTSDTEALVHLYEECGAQMVDQLRGMFAFAVYDRRQRQLLLARDRFGIKPLYYARHNGQWVFASEIKAILALTGFQPGIDRQACYDFLGLGYIPEPLTGFADVKALPKATTLVIGANGQQLTCYFRIQANPDSGRDLSEAVETVSATLLRGVNEQAVADVPVGAMLSGGIDSSLVVAAYCRTTDDQPTTFNARFPDKDYDETAVAQAASRHYQTRHHTIDLDEWADAPDLILRLLRHFDQPFADTSLIPTYWISKAIRERGIICVLSGDGGDEAFGGYARFWRANRLAKLMNLPAWLQKTTALTGEVLAKFTADFGRQLGKAAQLAQAGRTDAAVLLAGLSNYLNEEQKQELVMPGACKHLETVYRHFNGHQPKEISPSRSDSGLEQLSRLMTDNLFSVGLPSDMLRKVDMMSMLASIEVRVPMLSEDMVALGLALPHRLKTDGHTGKLVLRSLANRWLPQEVAAHPKHGFSIPIDRMMNRCFHQVIEDYLLASSARIRSFLNIRLVQKWLRLFKESQQGRRSGAISRGGLYQRIFMILALELWLREHRLSW